MADSIRRVLITDPIDPEFVSTLRGYGLLVEEKKLSPEKLVQEIVHYECLIVRSGTQVTADVIAAGTNLKLIGRAGTGVDNIDVRAATERNVLVMNTPGANTISAAEHTCGLIMSLSRSTPEACASLKADKWDRKLFMGNELYGKTLAIIGLGRIGREVATRMQAFGMKTVGYDPILTADFAQRFGVEFVPLNDIWSLADYITVHTPLVKDTENLVNLDVLRKCKKGVRVVNAARGGIVSESDLMKAIEEGTCAGAALDVFSDEPPTHQLRPLLEHPKVICTPHLGANTHEAQARVAVELAEQIGAFITTGTAAGFVNKINV